MGQVHCLAVFTELYLSGAFSVLTVRVLDLNGEELALQPAQQINRLANIPGLDTEPVHDRHQFFLVIILAVLLHDAPVQNVTGLLVADSFPELSIAVTTQVAGWVMDRSTCHGGAVTGNTSALQYTL